MLNMETPREYVLSSNETHTVKEFIELACESAELNYEWVETGIDLDEKLLVDGKIILTISEKYYRPAEVDLLYGCSKETREVLNWEPKIDFKTLVDKMVKHDIKLLE